MILEAFRFNQLASPIQRLVTRSKLERDNQQVAPRLVMELESSILHGMHTFIVRSGRNQSLFEGHVTLRIDVVGHHGITVLGSNVSQVMVSLTSNVRQMMVQTAERT